MVRPCELVNIFCAIYIDSVLGPTTGKGHFVRAMKVYFHDATHLRLYKSVQNLINFVSLVCGPQFGLNDKPTKMLFSFVGSKHGAPLH